jgi:hypothetical protein
VIEHRIVIDQLGLSGPEDDRVLVRGTAEAVTRAGAAAFIYEHKNFWGDDEPVAAIIPAGVARELILEGRLAGPPLAGMTVLARDRARMGPGETAEDAGRAHP